jgi:archaellum component FlaG (FlaF/FlaG flagellin family)
MRVVVIIRRRMCCIVLISVLTVIASGCAGGTTAPTAAALGNLTMTSMALNDAGQGARGDWQYNVTVYLRETGGVDTTVTNIQFQVLLASNILATASVVPALSVSANSSSDAGLVFAADTLVGDLSALTVGMTVQFRDANGNTGSVSNSFSGFGYWDY